MFLIHEHVSWQEADICLSGNLNIYFSVIVWHDFFVSHDHLNCAFKNLCCVIFLILDHVPGNKLTFVFQTIQIFVSV